MKTLQLFAENKSDIAKSCQLILADEVVAIPTETVYGLGANALSSTAISKIFQAKGRPQDNPLIVHISNINMLNQLVLDVSDDAKRVIDAFWPGAITIIFKKSNIVPDEISRGLDTIAIRFPNHKTACEIIEQSGVPIAAPSANLSGRPSTTTAQHVLEDLDGKISAVVFDKPCKVGLESTVLDLTRQKPVILRPGSVTKEQIEAVLGEIDVDLSVKESIDNSAKVSSPGMKYRHYAPKAKVTVLCGNSYDTANYIRQNAGKSCGILCFDEYADLLSSPFTQTFGAKDNIDAQAHNLFDKLRLFDEMPVTEIFTQCPNDDGLGLAVANRLKKSSGFNVICIKNRKIIGLTGASGSGKSTVSDIFSELSAKVISADDIYHNLLENSSEMKVEISKNFAIDCDKIDRKKLGEIVFADKSKLKILNSITHKYITKAFEKELFSTIDSNVIVLDIPLLFEANYQRYCDKVVGVIANNDEKISRLCVRDGISEEYAKIRLKNQKSNEFFKENCDIIIDNAGDLNELYKKCENIYNEIGE